MATEETIDVCSRGDVILICGPKANQKKLRVSSVILSETSDVFKALLSPRFKEGTEFAAASIVETPFPEDDPESMIIVCRVLHMRNKEVPKCLDICQIREVAILTDKYACMEAMTFVVRTWVQPHIEALNPSSLSSLLSSAYLFKDRYCFALVSTALVWRSPGYLKSDEEGGGANSVDNILQYLNNQKLRALARITSIIEEIIRSMAHRICTNPTCRSAGTCTSAFIQQIISQKLWPSSVREAKPLVDLIQALTEFEFKSPNSDYNNDYCRFAICSAQSNQKEMNAALHEKIKNVKLLITIPCLPCVQVGSIGAECACTHGDDSVLE